MKVTGKKTEKKTNEQDHLGYVITRLSRFK